METSPFMKLSAELRNVIYELVLVRRDPIKVLWPPSVHSGQTPQPENNGDVSETKNLVPANNNVLAFTQTCRRIRHESFKLFYASNIFVLPAGLQKATVPGLLGPFTRFYVCISSQAAAVLRHVIIDIGSIPGLQFSEGLMARKNWLELFIRMVEMSREGFPTESFQLRFELTFMAVEGVEPMVLRLEAHRPCEALKANLNQLDDCCKASLPDRSQNRLRRVQRVLKTWYKEMEVVNRLVDERLKFQPIKIEPLRPRRRKLAEE